MYRIPQDQELIVTTSASASIQHPLGRDVSIPKRISEDRLSYLTRGIRDGSITTEEREELGRGFIRLALKIAAGYAARNPSKGEDYSSAALFGIAYALKTAREKLRDDNITGWVIANIRRFIRRFWETDHIVRVPSTTYHKAKVDGRDLGKLSVHVVDNRELCAGEGVRASLFYHRVRMKSAGSIYDLKEIIQLSAKDDRDRLILKMRGEEYTDGEIASHLGISTSYVQRKRVEMEARFDRLNVE